MVIEKHNRKSHVVLLPGDIYINAHQKTSIRVWMLQEEQSYRFAGYLQQGDAMIVLHGNARWYEESYHILSRFGVGYVIKRDVEVP